MDKAILDSELPVLFLCGERSNNLCCPMYFGVSCAFFALKVLSGNGVVDDDKWSELCNKMLQGSAQLLGLLVWRAQRVGANEEKNALLTQLEASNREIERLKRIRHEDAKANEKVMGILAAREQSWLNERRKLREQIGSLVNDLRVLGKKKDENIAELNEKMKEMELVVQSKDKELEGDEVKRKELEEKLRKVEGVAEELKEAAKREAEKHSSELWKHKTTFIELVSNQRQLEAEMGRAVRQMESAKHELDSAIEQKEEAVLMVQKLSVELVKLQKDVEQKDNILSAMLRKSKLDTAEKQMLLKEVKLSKAKRKQAEQETERLRSVSESKHGGHSLRSMFINQVNMRLENLSGGRKGHHSIAGSSHIGKTRSQAKNLIEYGDPGFAKETESYLPISDGCTHEAKDALPLATTNMEKLEQWVHSEAEKYTMMIEQRHHVEIDAFVEQMRLKDEKLEACRWQLLSMEIESKRLQSHIEGLNKEMIQLRHKNMRLEAMLLEREEELGSLKEQVVSELSKFNRQKSITLKTVHESELVDGLVWAKAKNVKRRPEEEGEKLASFVSEISLEGEAEITKDISSVNKLRVTVQSPVKEFDEEKVATSLIPIKEETARPVDVSSEEKATVSSSLLLNKPNNNPWRMDLQALGVSYKIKRLKQQLLMLERLTGMKDVGENIESKEDEQSGVKSFLSMLSLLNKQVGRYQTLQEKIDDLCKRMHENDLDIGRGDSNVPRTKTKGETKTLEHFLEETFQLQRYMVATGQKLMEVQSKVAVGFIGAAEQIEKPETFDMKRFSESIRALFQEVQRGLEVRISRIIGDLEGTLACDGMTQLRR